MTRFRITVLDPPDRAEQIRRASRIRRDLIEQVKVRIDPIYPLQGIHRNNEGRAYLEFVTDDLDEVRHVLRSAGHERYAELNESNEPLGEACTNCGNIAGAILPAICPNCDFHDVSRCPICGELNPRTAYERIRGTLYLCPTKQEGIRHRVRLVFNEPMFNPDGSNRQPLVLVLEAVPE